MVTEFREKPVDSHDRNNGGFFVMEPEFLQRLDGDDCILEREPLSSLAGEGRLAVHPHDGFWKPMDTIRDRDELIALWESGVAPWATT
jgi:glucose-1-phosphate cytidylyltransferase